MSEELRLGLSLMAIGMATVFAILFLVVIGAKLLIRWTNYYYPEASITSTQGSKFDDSSKLAVIVAAVNILTGGRGNVESVRKVSD